MPIHQTKSALPGKRGDKRLAAVGTGCSRPDGIWTASVQHPNLSPSNWTPSGRTQLLHRHYRSLIGNGVMNATGLGLRQVGELRNVNAALRAERPTLRQFTAE
jgi:hypothetical protein